jgi:hypothetical protein
MGENGSYALDEKGRPVEVDRDDLKTKDQSILKTGWEESRDGLRRATAGKSVFNSEKNSVNSSANQNQDKQSGETENAKKNDISHNTPPNSDMSNSTTSESSKQGVNTDSHGRFSLIFSLVPYVTCPLG